MRLILCAREDPDKYSLMHYRTPGAKNGVRRFQNKDGSLTPEGYQHYKEMYGWGERKSRNADQKNNPQKKSNGTNGSGKPTKSGSIDPKLEKALFGEDYKESLNHIHKMSSDQWKATSESIFQKMESLVRGGKGDSAERYSHTMYEVISSRFGNDGLDFDSKGPIKDNADKAHSCESRMQDKRKVIAKRMGVDYPFKGSRDDTEEIRQKRQEDAKRLDKAILRDLEIQKLRSEHEKAQEQVVSEIINKSGLSDSKLSREWVKSICGINSYDPGVIGGYKGPEERLKDYDKEIKNSDDIRKEVVGNGKTTDKEVSGYVRDAYSAIYDGKLMKSVKAVLGSSSNKDVQSLRQSAKEFQKISEDLDNAFIRYSQEYDKNKSFDGDGMEMGVQLEKRYPEYARLSKLYDEKLRKCVSDAIKAAKDSKIQGLKEFKKYKSFFNKIIDPKTGDPWYTAADIKAYAAAIAGGASYWHLFPEVFIESFDKDGNRLPSMYL